MSRWAEGISQRLALSVNMTGVRLATHVKKRKEEMNFVICYLIDFQYVRDSNRKCQYHKLNIALAHPVHNLRSC